MQAQKSLNQRGVGVLHVLRAAAVKVAVFLDKLERIGRPVRAQGLHHVNVAKKEDRLFSRRALGAIADNKVHLVCIGTDEMHVSFRESRIEKAHLERRGRGGYVTLRRGGCFWPRGAVGRGGAPGGGGKRGGAKANPAGEEKRQNEKGQKR